MTSLRIRLPGLFASEAGSTVCTMLEHIERTVGHAELIHVYRREERPCLDFDEDGEIWRSLSDFIDRRIESAHFTTIQLSLNGIRPAGIPLDICLEGGCVA